MAYRVRQFLRGWRARVRPDEYAAAAALLSPAALALFDRMPVDGQVHSLKVLLGLAQQGDVPYDLAVAALLHDAGKAAAGQAGAYLGLWLRGPLVLAAVLWPGLLERLAAAAPSASPRYAVYVHLHHPAIGATWAAEAGCSPLTCWLIAHHQDDAAALVLPAGAPERELLMRLQQADGRN